MGGIKRTAQKEENKAVWEEGQSLVTSTGPGGSELPWALTEEKEI